MSITLTKVRGGYRRGEFSDFYGVECRIQESSLAEETCLWLGRLHELIDPNTKQPLGAMMCLTQSMAADLIPLLQNFVEYGALD